MLIVQFPGHLEFLQMFIFLKSGKYIKTGNLQIKLSKDIACHQKHTVCRAHSMGSHLVPTKVMRKVPIVHAA